MLQQNNGQFDSEQNQPAQSAEVKPSSETSNLLQDVDKQFTQKLDEKRKEYEKKAEEIKKRYDLIGSIGKDKAEFIHAKQINKLRSVADEKLSEFQHLTAQSKAERMALILGESEQKFEKTLFPYAKIIERVKKSGKLREMDFIKIEALLSAMDKLQTNPALEKLFETVLEKEKLSSEELDQLVDLITPANLNVDLSKADKNVLFESSQAGAVIGLLKENQRVELVEKIFSRKEFSEAKGIFENLLLAKVISIAQLRYLLDKKIFPEPYASELEERIKSGNIAKQQNDYQKKLDQVAQIIEGRNAINVNNKAFGMPLIMAATSLWGIATALINLKMNWDWKHPMKAFTEPYFLLGTAAATVGTVGGIALASPETYRKYRGKFVDFFSGKDTLEAKKIGQIEELNSLLEAEFSKNPKLLEFLSYQEIGPNGLNKSGIQIILDLAKKKTDEKKPFNFNLEEILKECGEGQRTLLVEAQSMSGGGQIAFKDSLRAVMAILVSTNRANVNGLQTISSSLKSKQGIS